MKEDKILYREFLDGKEEAFNQLINQYKNNLIYFITRYVKDREVAEDIFQDVMVYILENKEKYNSDYSLKTYLYTIAKSRAINYLRKTGKITELQDDFEDENLLEEKICSKERKEKIHQVMNKLPKDYQLVIYLTKMEGLSYKETAKIMDKTESQIKTLAHNSKKKLRKLLIKEKVVEMKNNKIIKLVSIILLIGIVTTGVVLAKDIESFIKSLFGVNTSDGVDTAVNHGYISEVKTEIQKAKGIEISVDSLIMDDFNFAMNFNVTLGEKYDMNEFRSMELEDLKITDEKGKTVFITHPYDKNMEYKGAYSFLAEEKGKREFKLSLSATGNPEVFPKSKHLTLQFTKVKTWRMDEENMIELNKFYEGNWNFEVDVPEEFYKRETIIYKARSCNEDRIDINTLEATLSNTAFKISIPVITSTDKIDYDLLHTSTPNSIYDKMALQKEYVETSDGRKFETAQRSDGDGGYGVDEENRIRDYHQTFNLTKYDATDEITVHIFTNKGEDIVIQLEKSK